VATPDEITRHHDDGEEGSEWIAGPRPIEPIHVVPYDDRWPAVYAQLAAALRTALGNRLLHVEHIGSTSVPGLAAKPIVDVDVTVADPTDEDAYVADLERAGFVFVIREPAWHQHRLFRLDEPAANVHVFGPDCPEAIRHVLLRDWLREHPDDAAEYVAVKLDAAAAATAAGESGRDYNTRKQPYLRALLDRIFAASDLH
jgi:GrpB-like predicted nucleotidyltransferase (UPF0157 family)